MTVRDLIEQLEEFDEDMEVKIGMIQNYGSNFAMEICDDVVEERTVHDWDYGDYKAVVITEGRQIGTVNYEDEED